MKKILLSLCLACLSCYSYAQQYAYTAATSGNAIPLGTGTTWDNYRSQFLYCPGDFGNTVLPGLINVIYFRANSASVATTFTDFKVSLGQSTNTNLTTYETGLTLVLPAASFTIPALAANQWFAIPLQTPFPFDPSLSLIVDISQTGKVGGLGGISLQAGGVPVNPIYTGFTQVYGLNSGASSGRRYSYQFGFDLLPKKGFNNASVSALTLPAAPFCSGSQPVQVLLKNTGYNQINSVNVFMEADGVLQPVTTYTGLIDTIGSIAGNSALVSIGNVNYSNAPRTLRIYTSEPNGIADTVNRDDTLVITHRSSPLANASATGTTIFCTGGIINVTLNAATGTGYTYKWKYNGTDVTPAATGSSYIATTAGDYVVQVDSGACSNTSNNIRIENLAMPQPSIFPDTRGYYCDRDSVELKANANISGATYQWMYNGQNIPGATNATIFAKAAGNYNITTTKGSCLATSPGVNILQVQPPAPVITESGNSLVTQSTFVSYQWKEDGSPIAGATNWYFIPEHAGKYSVVVSNGGCSVETDEFATTLTVNNLPGNTAINIYPNPAKDVLHISPFLNLNASIYSVDGRLIIKEMHAKTVNVTTLPKGVYIIKLTDDDSNLIKTQKLVKE